MHMCKRQMPAALVALVLAVACVSAQSYPPTVSVPTAAPAAQLPIASLTVPAFASIDVCLPVNVLVVPTTSTNYTVTAGAEPGVLQALSASVEAGVLYLQSYGTFNTSNVVTLQVSVPANNLTGIALNSRAQVSLAQGFTSPDFAVAVNGSGDVYALSVSTQNLTINLRGEGNVLVNGTISDAVITSTGDGDVYVIGTTRSVAVNTSDDGDIKLLNANANVVMTGMSSGDGDVDYNVGNCNVMQIDDGNDDDNDDDNGDRSAGVDDNACDQDRISLPNLNPMWSCGISVTRSFTCAAGPRQAQSIAAASGMSTTGPNMPPAIGAAAVGASGAAATPSGDDDNDDRVVAGAAGATPAGPATPAGGDADDNDDNNDDSTDDNRTRRMLQIDDDADDDDNVNDTDGVSTSDNDDDNNTDDDNDDDDNDDDDDDNNTRRRCSATPAQRMIFVS